MMLGLSKGQKNKKKFFIRFFPLIGGVILIFILINFFSGWQKRQTIDQDISGMQNEIINLQEGNTKLKKLIEYFNSTAYIEEKARLDLGLKKAGENVVLVDQQNQDLNLAANGAIDSGENQNIINPIKWWRYFFN